MKLIIDIPEEEWLFIKAKIAIEDDSFIDRVVANGKPIPDNATNGDVIDAMFPNVDFVTDVFGGFNFPKWWWNAPYQKGSRIE